MSIVDLLYFATGVIVVVTFLANRHATLLRRIGISMLALLAIGFTSLALFLVHVGISNKWTSDGPGMLGVMMGILLFGVCALVSWGSLIVSWRGRKRLEV
jgi:hypothetical protein